MRRVVFRGTLKEERTKFLCDDFVKIGPGKRQVRVTPSDYSGGHGVAAPLCPILRMFVLSSCGDG